MSDGFSAIYANACLNLLNGTNATGYSTVYAELRTGDPGPTGTASNVSAGSTTREAVTFGTASNSSGTSTIAITNTPTWTNGGTTETLTDVAYWTAPTGGTFITSESLSAPEPWSSGNTFELQSASISLPTAS